MASSQSLGREAPEARSAAPGDGDEPGWTDTTDAPLVEVTGRLRAPREARPERGAGAGGRSDDGARAEPELQRRHRLRLPQQLAGAPWIRDGEQHRGPHDPESIRVFTDAAPSRRVEHDPTVVKPETYYGDGPFDPPSSDDEDEELLEKNARSMHPDDPELEDGTGLIIGGHQVRIPKLHRPACANNAMFIETMAIALSRHWIGKFSGISDHYRNCCCVLIYWNFLPNPGNKAYHDGPPIQRNVWLGFSECSLGA